MAAVPLRCRCKSCGRHQQAADTSLVLVLVQVLFFQEAVKGMKQEFGRPEGPGAPTCVTSQLPPSLACLLSESCAELST